MVEARARLAAFERDLGATLEDATDVLAGAGALVRGLDQVA
jgi:hypothetical protein